MKKHIIHLAIILLVSCQKDEISFIRLSEYSSEDYHIEAAIIKIKEGLTSNKIDSFYVERIEKKSDSVKVYLFPNHIVEQIRKSGKDEWVVLPP